MAVRTANAVGVGVVQSTWALVAVAYLAIAIFAKFVIGAYAPAEVAQVAVLAPKIINALTAQTILTAVALAIGITAIGALAISAKNASAKVVSLGARLIVANVLALYATAVFAKRMKENAYANVNYAEIGAVAYANPLSA